MTEPAPALDQPTTSDNEAGGVDVSSAARNIGLKPIRAWVPDGKQRNRNASVERTKRSRAKAEAQGLRQLSITLPAELHPLLKQFATRTKAGEPFQSVLTDLIDRRASQQRDQAPAARMAVAGVAAPTIRNLPAWRRVLIWWLLTPDLRRALDR